MSEQRKVPRVPLHCNVYVIHNNCKTEHGKILDISELGAGIYLPNPKNIGEQFQIAFRVQIGKRFEEFLCFVTAVHCHLQHDHFYIGVAFRNLPQDQRSLIQKYVLYKSKTNK